MGSAKSVMGPETARCLAVPVRRVENSSIAGDSDRELPIWFWFTLLQAHGVAIARSRLVSQRRSPRNQFDGESREAGSSPAVSNLFSQNTARGAFGSSFPCSYWIK